MQTAVYILFFCVTTGLSLLLAVGWWLSPLSIGFSGAPKLAGGCGLLLYKATYYLGIPWLLASPVVSAWMASRRHMWPAYLVPVATLAIFLASVTWLLSSTWT